MNLRTPLLAVAGLCLGGCLNSGSDGTTTPAPVPVETSYTISGTVSGLTGDGLRLDAGIAKVAISEEGSFTLPFGLHAGGHYSISIDTHPGGQLCTVANGTGTVGNSDVTDVEVDCAKAVKVSGQVTDAPIAFASVSIKVGDQFYTTVADEDGFFSLPVAGITGDEMVISEAQGAESQTHVTFASILGTFAQLADDAGDEGEVEGSNVTNVTTAAYVLIARANDGEVPTTGEALQTAERSVDATEVMQLAAAIKLIVDDPENFQLPDGKADIMAFASDSESVREFVDAAPPEKMEQALTEILADASLIPGFQTTGMPGDYYLGSAAQPGFLQMQGNKLELRADGTGLFLTSGASATPVTASLEWRVDEGILKVEYPEPVVTSSFPQIQDTTATDAQAAALVCAGIGQPQMTNSVTGRDYVLLRRGTMVDQVRVTALSEQSWAPIPVPDHCEGEGTTDGEVLLASRVQTNAGNSEMLKAAQLPAMPFTADMVAGEWGVPLYSSLGATENNGFADAFAIELVSFGAGGTTSAVRDDAITWEVADNGNLVLEYGDYVQEIRVLDRIGPARTVFSEVTSKSDDDLHYGYQTAMVKRSAEFAAAASEMDFWVGDGLDDFWQSYINGWRPDAWQDGEPIYGGGALNFGWSFVDADTAFRRDFWIGWVESNMGERGVDNDQHVPAVDAGGRVTLTQPWWPDFGRERSWIALGQDDAGRVYVAERHRQQMGTPDWVPIIAPRITVLGRVDAPETVHTFTYIHD